ncbi:MAG: hypothetical protein COS90_01870 [Deltaproteobacteria bacterium CG07_land_8_20_14_0_80_60_11]|nr:MAG: hypothetical protein COS90_01870 [Deltaproteobacteria bacterium CG07_land_8_20_14_0_80_60_11]
MENLIRVSKAENLPFKKQTFYKWWHLKKHPEIFIKFSGALFIDLAALERAMNKTRLSGHVDEK